MPRVQRGGLVMLTERERAVLGLVALGLTDRQIGKQLAYSQATIRLEMATIKTKLGVTSRTAAACIAVAEGLIDAPKRREE